MPTVITHVRPPLRWAGSKRKSVGALSLRLPEKIDTYIEPFAGSACLAFAIPAKRRVLGDLNPRLIEFYEMLRDHPRALHNRYKALAPTPDNYYKIRNEFNETGRPIDQAARFLFLNRHCFNGIYRVNRKGQFNVPWGGDKVGKPLTLSDLTKASNMLTESLIVCEDFETLVDSHLAPGTFVYLDPPYARDEQRVFREYHENSFATRDWTRLVALLERIDAAGARFLLSYAGDQELIERLDRWSVGHLDVTRNVGGFKATRRKYREFIAMNYEPNA